MVLDLKLENKISRLLKKDNLVLSLNSRIKEKGMVDPMRVSQLYHNLLKGLSEQDKLHGTFLSIRDCVGYAIENAINHGGEEIKTEIYATSTEFLCKISDSGSGFDVEGTINKFHNSEKYYSLFGQGLKGMEESCAKVGFNKKGNTTFIYTRIEEEKARARAKEDKEILNNLKEILLNDFKNGNYYSLKADPSNFRYYK